MNTAVIDARLRRSIVRDGDCWMWKGARDKDGYPIFFPMLAGEAIMRPHRLLLALQGQHGPWLDCTCGHPKDCVNPDHWYRAAEPLAQWMFPTPRMAPPTLPKDPRDAIVRDHAINGMPVSESARRIGCSEDTVKRRRRRMALPC